MTRTDSSQTQHSHLEALLGDAYGTELPPSAIRRMDHRLAVLRHPSVRRATEYPRRPGRRATVLGLAFAVLILGAAGGGLVGLAGLYQSMVGSDGAFRVQWDQATPLALSKSASGYRVTLERAYADANEVMIAVSVQDAQGREASQVAATGAHLTDGLGNVYDGTGAYSSPDGAFTAANLVWFRTADPLAGGSRTFHLVFNSIGVRDTSTPPPSDDPSWNPWGEVDGPWTFDFTLAVRAGSTVDPKSVATVDGVTLRLRDVTATDATIRAAVEIVRLDAPGSGWTPVGGFEHAGGRFEIAMGMNATGGAMGVEALRSTADRSGEWVLRVDELVGQDGEAQVRLQGPWRLRFTLP